MSDTLIKDAIVNLQKALDHLHQEYGKLQTGRASAALVEGILVESYGTKMPLKGLANIAVPESNQITIQPWDRGQIQAIEKAIRDAQIGLNPQSDGLVVRLILPPLTEERRKELVKRVHQNAEEARIALRNARHETMNQLKQMEKEKKMSEDDLRHWEKELQNKVDDFNKKIEEAAKRKEEDVMRV